MATGFPKPQLINPLTPTLVKRGLTVEDAASIELTWISGQDVRDETNIHGLIWVDGAQRLPYFDVDGHPIPDPKTGKQFCRYRLENKPTWVFPPDFKPMKYVQAKPSSSHIAYVPRGVGVDWHRITADSQEPIVFTEGEYKAIAACKAEIPTVGLGGIWMFAQDSRKMPVPLENVNWVGRPVQICFDAHETSTAEEPLRPNDELKAAKAFANKLTIIGAEPKMLYIARTQTFLKQSPRIKMGIDDFLEAGGTAEELAATAEDIEPDDKVLTEMIRDWCICVNSKPFIMDRATGQYKHGSADFVNVIAADKKVRKPVGEKVVLIPAGRAFLDLPTSQRPVFHKMVFNPELDFGLDMERDHFNMWKGMRTLPAMKDPDSLARDVAIWRKYLGGLGGEENVEFLEKYLAHLVQRPWEKTNVAIVLGGRTQGTGKSLYGAIAGALVGEQYRHSGTFDDFFGDYKGSNIDSKLIIQIEESEGLGKAQMAKLKDFITNPRVNISIKYIPDYTNDNLGRVIITSNALDPVKVDETDRRTFIVRTKLTQEEVVGGWREWCGREVWERFCLDKSQDGDWPRRQLMYHLMNCVDLSAWDATAAPPVTEDMEDMIEATRDAGELGMIELYGMLNQSKDGFWILPKNFKALNSKFWDKFIDFVKVRGGMVMSMETRAFGERDDVRVIARKGLSVPVRKEGKGGGKFKTVVDYSTWGLDAADQVRAKDELLTSFEKIAPVLRLSEDHIAAIRAFKDKKYSK